ncbi:MAG: thioredoxin family protein [Myxococcota bacterium]
MVTLRFVTHFASLVLVGSFALGCSSNATGSAAAPSATDAPEAAPVAETTTTRTKDAAPTQPAVLGQAAPDFTLTDLDGKTHRLADYRGKTVVLEWFNPDCPFVRQSHTEGTLKGLAQTMVGDDLVWLAVNSGAPGKQGHGREANQAGRTRYGIDHPILLDPSGAVGKAYGAKRTPHMYVIDPTGKLVYRGAIDNSKGGDLEDVSEVENYVAKTVTLVRAGQSVDLGETPAWGCTVKYAN